MSFNLLRTNVGPADRVIRVVLGVALLLLAVIGPKIPWGYVGILPLLTGLFGSCPLYSLTGLSTCPVRPR
jgi:hypothetical protein